MEGTGAVKGVSEKYKYTVIVRLLFNDNDNYTIDDNEYEFYAYVSKNNSNQILLGQRDRGLKPFFEKGYCITYNDSKVNYVAKDTKNINMLNRFREEINHNISGTRINNTISNDYIMSADIILRIINKIMNASATTTHRDKFNYLNNIFDLIKNVNNIEFRNVIYNNIKIMNYLNINTNIVKLYNDIIGNYNIMSKADQEYMDEIRDNFVV